MCVVTLVVAWHPYSWHGVSWCGYSFMAWHTHGVATHSWHSALMVQLPIHGVVHAWHDDSCHNTFVHGAVTLLICSYIFMPMKIIAWVVAECDLEHSSLPVPPRGKALHHVGELWVGT